jgi:hypothetical protein
MDQVANGQQGLERNHYLVIFDEVPHQHENLLGSHTPSFRHPEDRRLKKPSGMRRPLKPAGPSFMVTS